MSVRFTVFGGAQPAGSKRAFYRPQLGVRIVDANPKAKEFKSRVASEAAEAMHGQALFEGPLHLAVIFYRSRPKSHLGKRGLRTGAPAYPDTKPDLLKLTRGVEDAMEGIVYRNDSQICEEHLVKEFGNPERIEILVRPL